ncbi:ABC transporter ATP-binding protein [Amaricoccus tamworthensis]|uniref:ABC transporter ATP-binding protein n=1 Tax=Amaricoccus tamworthensis TaxID=57002 RepID=UPI003C7B6458
MSKLSLVGVRKCYGTFEAIPSLDLEIADGEFCVFVGPSGCGKSTLLRTIVGLEELTEGQIHIGEREVGRLSPGDRSMAMVFQNYALYPHMTVAQNIGYPLKLARVSKPEIKKRTDEVARSLGLGALLERKPAELSGGQRQRVAIGRAVIREPEAFLFDEPLSNLDAELRVKMRLEIAEMQRRLGATTIYVTHDQVEAMTLADRIVVLRDGRIEQVGPPLELYDNPRNLFVARFIGSPAMNLLEVVPRGADMQLPQLEGLVVPTPAGVTPRPGMLLGVRPEHLNPVEDGGSLTVGAVEHLGGTSFAYTAGSEGDDRLCAELGENRTVVPGTTVRVGIREGRYFLFERNSGTRLY